MAFWIACTVSLIGVALLLRRKGRPAWWTILGLALLAAPLVLLALGLSTFFVDSTDSDARAKQNECKANLIALYDDEVRYFAEQHRYATGTTLLRFKPEPDHRYTYFISPDQTFPADPARFHIAPKEHAMGLADARVDVGQHGTCPNCSFTAACVGNLDRDPVLDVWSISTVMRTLANGSSVPAGELYNDVNDVTTP